MEADANKLAEQAEHTSKLTILAKSNALRRGARDKRQAMELLDEQIKALHDGSA